MKLEDALSEQKQDTQQSTLEIFGTLGIPIGGQRVVEVPTRNSFVYVRLRNNQNEVIQAFNNQVAPSYGLPVIVVRESTRYIIKAVDTLRYQSNWNSFAPYLPRHGNTHSFSPDTDSGGDVAWIYSRQFMPLLGFPSGTLGGPNIVIAPHTLESVSGTWRYLGNTGTASFLPYVPTNSTGAWMVLVYLDVASGNPYLIVNSGTIFSNGITGTAAVVPYIPNVPDPGTQIPLVAVRLVTGTSTIGWNNLYDVRQWLQPIVSGSGGGGAVGSSLIFYDENTLKGSALELNVRGNTAALIVTGTRADLFISGSTQYDIFNGTSLNAGEIQDGDFWGLLDSSDSYFVAKVSHSQLKENLRLFFNNRYQPSGSVARIQDDGTPLGTAYTFNFGNGLAASISGSVVQVDATSASGTVVNIQDDGASVGSASTFNFGSNINATVSGTVAHLNVQIQDYISGLDVDYVSSGTISVSPGQAYVPSLGRMVVVTGTITQSFTIPVPTGTWQHVYLWENSGVPSIQVTGTVPSNPYVGRARTKSDNTAYRYLGSLLPDDAGYLYRFNTATVGGSMEMSWLWRNDVVPFLLGANLTGSTPQTISAAGLIPVSGIVDELLIVGVLTAPAGTIAAAGIGETILSTSYIAVPFQSGDIYFRIDNQSAATETYFFSPGRVKLHGTNIQYVSASSAGVTLQIRVKGIRIPRS